MKKYEVKVLMTHSMDIDDEDDVIVNKKIAKLQDEGWEISGDILIKNPTGHCLDTWLFIPFKRKI